MNHAGKSTIYTAHFFSVYDLFSDAGLIIEFNLDIAPIPLFFSGFKLFAIRVFNAMRKHVPKIGS